MVWENHWKNCAQESWFINEANWQRGAHPFFKGNQNKTLCQTQNTVPQHGAGCPGSWRLSTHTPGSWELQSTGSPWPTAWSQKQPHRPAGPGRAHGAGAGKPRCCRRDASAATRTRVTPAHPIAASCWTHARQAPQNLGEARWLLVIYCYQRGIEPALPSHSIAASSLGEFLRWEGGIKDLAFRIKQATVSHHKKYSLIVVVTLKLMDSSASPKGCC